MSFIIKRKANKGILEGLDALRTMLFMELRTFIKVAIRQLAKPKKGHMLVHTMQSGENLKVRVNGAEYSVIQISTYNTCHNSGRRVSLQYQGLFPVDRGGAYVPFNDDGTLQRPNATYLYKHIKEDVHYKARMLAKTATQAQICTAMKILAQLLWRNRNIM